MTPINDLAAAFMLLTRLPVVLRPAASPAHAAWAFPIVGGVVGVLAGGVLWVADRLHLPPVVGAAWTVAALLLLTGGLHEDGLADTADGLGGGTRERKLAIMRDSRIGSFGTVALIVSITIRTGAIAGVPPGAAVAVLAAVGALARASMVVPILLLPSARPGGLGDIFAAGPRTSAGFGLLIAVILCLALLPIRPALTVLLGTAIAALAMSGLAMRQIGGYTGDILGAVEQVSECVALTVLSAA